MSKLLISNFVPDGFRPGLSGPLHEQLSEVWHILSGLHVAAHRFVVLTDKIELDAWDRLLAETMKAAKIRHVDLAFSSEAVQEEDRPKFREHLDAMVERLDRDGISATWSALQLPGPHTQSKGYALVDERESHTKAGLLVVTSADLTLEGFGYSNSDTMELGLCSSETDSVVHFVELFDALRTNYRQPW